MKNNRLFSLAWFLIGGIAFACNAMNLSGTLLLTDSVTSQAWCSGNLLMMDLKTGRTDTLVRGKADGAVFSPDGRKVVYSHGGYAKVMDLHTRSVENYFPGPLDGLSWSKADEIYFVAAHYICRYRVSTRQIDTVHKVVGDFFHELDTTNYFICEGNVSASADRACFMVAKKKGWNYVLGIAIGGTEVLMNDGTASRTSCQGGISPDGNWTVNVNTNHNMGFVHPFQRNDSIHLVLYPTYNSLGQYNPIWMFRFSRSSNNRLLFHSPKDSMVYLWLLDVNRFYPVAKKACAWDLFAPGWVLDTIPPNPPAGLQAGNITEASITLNWAAPSAAAPDGDRPSYYVIMRNDSVIATTNQLYYMDTGLVENTLYNYGVFGKDNGVRLSGAAAGAFRTLADYNPPLMRYVYSLSDTVTHILLNETADSITAVDAANFSFSPVVTIRKSLLTEKCLIRLSTSSFGSNPACSLRMTGMKDKASAPNTSGPQALPVTTIRSSIGSKEWDLLAANKLIYWPIVWNGIFREYFRHVPEKFKNLPYLRVSQAASDNSDTASTFIQFDVNRPSRVYVACYRAGGMPWLKDWTLTGDTIEQYIVYAKDFPSGAVALKGNIKWATPYTVIVKPLDSSMTGGETIVPAIEEPILNVFPRPFVSFVNLHYFMPIEERVNFAIFDLQGKRLAILLEKIQGAGSHRVYWEGSDTKGNRLANGVYFLRCDIGRKTFIRRIAIIR